MFLLRLLLRSILVREWTNMYSHAHARHHTHTNHVPIFALICFEVIEYLTVILHSTILVTRQVKLLLFTCGTRRIIIMCKQDDERLFTGNYVRVLPIVSCTNNQYLYRKPVLLKRSNYNCKRKYFRILDNDNDGMY